MATKPNPGAELVIDNESEGQPLDTPPLFARY
jgi:hypothetical protein